MKNKTYQSRMDQTQPNKIQALSSVVERGDRVLDFGAGRSLAIYDYVKSIGGEYVPLDHDLDTRKFFEDTGIDCPSSVFDLEGEFDVIFMSSVVHEILSFLPPEQAQRLFEILIDRLKDGGHLIIRDWYVYDQKWADNYITLTATSKGEGDIVLWVQNLLNSQVVSNIIQSDLTFGAHYPQMYELIYHSVWGKESIPVESKERYAIPQEDLDACLHQLKLVDRYDDCDGSYALHLAKLWDGGLVTILNEMPTKTVLVYQKQTPVELVGAVLSAVEELRGRFTPQPVFATEKA